MGRTFRIWCSLWAMVGLAFGLALLSSGKLQALEGE
jgi:hypothetical protein